MGAKWKGWAFAAPALVLLAVLLAAPVAVMGLQSFRPFVAGRIGAGEGWTLHNYAELIHPAYAFYFFDTFRIGVIVSAIALALSAPLAWVVARTKRRWARTAIYGLVFLFFPGLIVFAPFINLRLQGQGEVA